MRQEKSWLLGAALLAAVLCLNACGSGVRPSSASSDEDAGQIRVDQAPPAAPTDYTTQAGDTLKTVAARPEIYGDPDLWPLLKDANAESLADRSADSPLAADVQLEIPRGSTPEALAAARETARAYAAQIKAHASARPVSEDNFGAGPGDVAETPVSHAAPTEEAAQPGKAPAAAPTSVAAPVPAPARAGSKNLPLYLLLALVLAALAAVFYVFFQRDKRDFD